ncbi:MAG: C1 family peptidase [Verrucomicrobiales bacterium]|nr:C1 family peptidase [Verrucomicrobiales bacterium]
MSRTSDHGKGRVAGIQKDVHDPRDHEFDAGDFEEAKDLRHYLFDVENQKASEGCAGFAMSTILEMWLKRDSPARAVELSPLFAWWNARFLEGEAERNEPVTARAALKTLRRHGICPESAWRFDESKWFVRPSRTAFRTAKHYRISAYRRCRSVEAIKSAISQELPVFLGMEMREGFANISGSLETHPRQFVGYRRNPKTGGHFMAIVGYRREGAIVVNSWGTDFHDQGCVLIPWDVLVEDQYDVWVVTGLEVRKPRRPARKSSNSRKSLPARRLPKVKPAERPVRSRKRKPAGSRSALNRRP